MISQLFLTSFAAQDPGAINSFKQTWHGQLFVFGYPCCRFDLKTWRDVGHNSLGKVKLFLQSLGPYPPLSIRSGRQIVPGMQQSTFPGPQRVHLAADERPPSPCPTLRHGLLACSTNCRGSGARHTATGHLTVPIQRQRQRGERLSPRTTPSIEWPTDGLVDKVCCQGGSLALTCPSIQLPCCRDHPLLPCVLQEEVSGQADGPWGHDIPELPSAEDERIVAG